MATQKVFKVGNSLVVTIPKELAVKYNLEPGVEMVSKESKEGIIFKPLKKIAPSKELKNWLVAFEKKYDHALRELAKH